jgi:hypothetical protein
MSCRLLPFRTVPFFRIEGLRGRGLFTLLNANNLKLTVLLDYVNSKCLVPLSYPAPKMPSTMPSRANTGTVPLLTRTNRSTIRTYHMELPENS